MRSSKLRVEIDGCRVSDRVHSCPKCAALYQLQPEGDHVEEAREAGGGGDANTHHHLLPRASIKGFC